MVYFMTGCLPQISSSWRQAPWRLTTSNFFFQLNTCDHSPYVTWWEDGSVFYNSCWALPAQSFSGPSPTWLITTFYGLIRDSPNLQGQVPVLTSPRKRVAVIPPGTGFPFSCLLWLTGLRWRYLPLPPHRTGGFSVFFSCFYSEMGMCVLLSVVKFMHVSNMRLYVSIRVSFICRLPLLIL
jgi:hypothetical protein